MLNLCEPSAGVADKEVAALTEAIAGASCPEEAARLGRRAQRCQPHLVRPDWDTAKLAVMQAALHAKVRLLSKTIPGHIVMVHIMNLSFALMLSVEFV